MLSRIAALLARWYRHAQRAFHALVGTAFLIAAVAGGLLAFSEWKRYREDPAAGLTAFGMFAGFTLVLVILSLYSFLRARSVR